MSADNPTESAVIEAMAKDAAEIIKKRKPCPPLANEYGEILLRRLAKLLREDGDKELEAAATAKLSDQIQKRMSSHRQAKPRRTIPKVETHPVPLGAITVTSYDYTWGADSGGTNTWQADASNGEMNIHSSTVGDTSNYAAAGIGYGFTPPSTGQWTFTPRIEYEYCAGTFPTVTGGASSTAYWDIRIFTYVKGVYSSVQNFETSLWNLNTGKSNNPTGPQDCPQNDTPTTVSPNIALELSSSNFYVFWVWFEVETSAGSNTSQGTGWIEPVVTSMTFVTP
jgi:hypothetical protein